MSWTEYYRPAGKVTVRPSAVTGYIIGDYRRQNDGTFRLHEEVWAGDAQDCRDVLGRFYGIHYHLMGDPA